MRRALSGQHRAYWFPLALLGFLVLGWTAITADAAAPWMTYERVPEATRPYFTVLSAVPMSQYSSSLLSTDQFPDHLGMRGYSPAWISAVLVVYLATMIWYAVLLRRSGVSVSPGRTTAVALGGGLALWLGYVLLTWLETVPDPLRLLSTTTVSLVLLGLCALGWAHFGTGGYRRTATILGVTLIGTVACSAVVSLVQGAAGTVVVTVALLVLARLERSVLLAVIGILFLATDVVFPPGLLANQLGAAVVFGGVIAVLLRGGRTAAAAA